MAVLALSPKHWSKQCQFAHLSECCFFKGKKKKTTEEKGLVLEMVA